MLNSSIYEAAYTALYILFIQKALIQDILSYLNQFPLTFGWYTTGLAQYDEKGNRIKGRDSDFFILHQRCLFHDLKSPVEITKKYTRLSINKHIDLNRIFSLPAIQNNVFGRRYRTAGLGDVSLALLGIGKLERLNTKKIEMEIQYVKRDAELTMLLAQYNNCLVSRLMKVFASYAMMDYYQTCHNTTPSVCGIPTDTRRC